MAIELELDQVINAETGVQPLIDGLESEIWVVPVLDPGSVDGGMVIESGFYVIAGTDDVANSGIVAGRKGTGTVLTINDADYLVRAIDPDGHGGAILGLEPV